MPSNSYELTIPVTKLPTYVIVVDLGKYQWYGEFIYLIDVKNNIFKTYGWYNGNYNEDYPFSGTLPHNSIKITKTSVYLHLANMSNSGTISRQAWVFIYY
jgi:hypothetical protein